MPAVGGVGHGADVVGVESDAGASVPRRVAGPQIINQKLDELTQHYNDISKRLKSLKEKTNEISTDQKDKRKLRSELEDAARLRQSFDEVKSSRAELRDKTKTRSDADRLAEFSVFEALQRSELDNVQSTLVARANSSLAARLNALVKEVETFLAKHGGEKEDLEKRDLEQRVAEADKDLGLIRGALDSLCRSTDSFIKNLASVQQPTTDDLAATLQEIKILLKP